MGSGVVGFNVAPKKAIFADSNPHIINFYKAVQNNEITPSIAKFFLQEQGILLADQGQDYFNEVRKRFNAEHNSLDFLFLNRSCFIKISLALPPCNGVFTSTGVLWTCTP